MKKGGHIVFFLILLSVGIAFAQNIIYSDKLFDEAANSYVTVPIYIKEATNLYAFKFDITYDNIVLQYNSLTPGPFLSHNGQVTLLDDTDLNLLNSSTPGVVSNIILSRSEVDTGVNGEGLLLTLNFNRVSPSTYLIEFTDIQLSDPAAASIASYNVYSMSIWSIPDYQAPVDQTVFFYATLEDANGYSVPTSCYITITGSTYLMSYASGQHAYNANFNTEGTYPWTVVCHNTISSQNTITIGGCAEGAQQSCGDTNVGTCTYGTQTCYNSEWGLCQGAIYPTSEICDGQDNDCDGTYDEGLAPHSCVLQSGVCVGSVAVCGGSSGWLNCGSIQYGPYYEEIESSCDNRDNDCNGQTDEFCQCMDGEQQQCGTTSIGECQYGTQNCQGGDWGLCVGAINPTDELCDGLDNDCDGTIDDEVGTLLCPLQVGVCAGSIRRCGGSNGWLTCGATEYSQYYESVETSCDNQDNDCDGITDEGCQCVDGQQQLCGSSDVGECSYGVQTCLYGQWGFCEGANYPINEICDGQDNDCDGGLDEGLISESCALQSGVCAGSVAVCGGGNGWLQCGPIQYGSQYQQIETSCDHLDNDCDGQSDEGCQCADGEQQQCGTTDVGQCQLGTQTCVSGDWSYCVGSVNPTTEICDGLDNDCDGALDNQLQPPLCALQTGVCAGAVRNCGGTSGWLTCAANEYGPNYELIESSCDNLDNDCDGIADETCECSPGSQQQCGSTDIGQCAYGSQTCVNGHWSFCEGVINPTAENCDGYDNDCNSVIDEGLPPVYCPLQTGVCAGSARICGGIGGWLSCGSAQYGSNYEPIESSCDNMDNDCDSLTDEGCLCVDGQQQQCGVSNVGQCDYGTQWCSNGDWGLCQGAKNPANEICDGLDNNCEGLIDEDIDPLYCPLQWGVCAGSVRICSGTAGWLSCGSVQYGYNYQLIETLCDGFDNDCDGLTDEGCNCIDGLQGNCGSTDTGECAYGTQTCTNGDWGLCQEAIYPNNEECDGLDNDCDSITDNDLTPPPCQSDRGVCAGSVKVCGGTAGWMQCGATQYGPNYEQSETSCDGLDNDCDGIADENCECSIGELRQCGTSDIGECQYGQETCTYGSWGFCEGAVNPAEENCNGLDNNCNGLADDGLQPPTCSLQMGVCTGALRSCGGSSGWMACDKEEYGPNYELNELSCDGLDNDCDGLTDGGCACIDGELDQCGSTDTGRCQYGTQTCENGDWGLCQGAIHSTEEICNGFDDNCDGATDEGLAQPSCVLYHGVCAGSLKECGSTLGWLTCGASQYGAYYESMESSCDGLDNDCDSLTDEGCQCIDGDTKQCGTSDIGNCEFGIQTCTSGQWGNCEGAISPTDEVCDGIDNDCDSLIDEQLVEPPCAMQGGVCAGSVAICGGTAGWLQCGQNEYGPNYETVETSCDRFDNDCDGIPDEDCLCVDGEARECGSADAGECRYGEQSCTNGQWSVCEGVINPSQEECDDKDNDCNGIIDDGLTPESCLMQAGVCSGSVKVCDGANGWIPCGSTEYGPNYEIDETSCDRVNNDCDSQTDEGCACIDGQQQQCGTSDVGECSFGMQTCANGQWGFCEGAIDPVNEQCDGLDNDCDGAKDEELTPVPCLMQYGVCAGSYSVCGGTVGWLVCGVNEYGPNYEATETSCEQLDNNCDGQTDEHCTCMDGDVQLCGTTDTGFCQYGSQTCSRGQWGLCQGAINPADEICDGLDNDCDGNFDEGLTEPACFYQTGVCVGSVKECGGLQGWLSCAANEYGPNYEITEASCDVLDNDCDSTTDEDCLCTDGEQQQCGSSDMGACQYGTQTCQGGEWGDCVGVINPSTEVCDGVDNDCDSLVDEDLIPPACARQSGVCIGSIKTCGENGWSDCNQDQYGLNFEETEQSCDNIDNDCDGQTDEHCACMEGDEKQCGTTDRGQCQYGTQKCFHGQWEDCLGAVYPGLEVCDWVDNDCDGNVDEDVCVITEQEMRLSQDDCAEAWSCGDWGACIYGRQMRACFDENNCGSAFQKPATDKDCAGEIQVTDHCTDGIRNMAETDVDCGGSCGPCVEMPTGKIVQQTAKRFNVLTDSKYVGKGKVLIVYDNSGQNRKSGMLFELKILDKDNRLITEDYLGPLTIKEDEQFEKTLSMPLYLLSKDEMYQLKASVSEKGKNIGQMEVSLLLQHPPTSMFILRIGGILLAITLLITITATAYTRYLKRGE